MKPDPKPSRPRPLVYAAEPAPAVLPVRRRTLSAPVRGALCMTAASFGFALMNLLVRLAAEEVNPIEIAFFRNLFALAFMLPWVMRVGPGASLRTARIGRHFTRSLTGVLGMFTWFTAIALLPMAQAVALNFTAPLFTTVGAALFLGEVVRGRRWSATAVGFLGTLLILRPGFSEVKLVALLPILASVLMAASSLQVKSLARTDPPGTLVLYMNLFMTPLSLVPALFVWSRPDLHTWTLLVALGLVAAVSHVFLVRAYAAADASAVQPFDYTRLPFVALFGYLAFGEVPSGWLWPGAAVIAGSAVYITHREARLARRGREGNRDS